MVRPKRPPSRGSDSSTSAGAKPAVAYVSQQFALSNIQGKLNVLVRELKRLELGCPKLLEFLPKSVRQFNLWTPIGSEGNQHKRNSRETLLKYPDTLKSIERAIQASRTENNNKSKTRDKETNLAASRRSGALNKVMREISERELIKARAALSTAQAKLTQCESKLASLSKEASRIRKLDMEAIEFLRAENAKLTALYNKVVPIRTK